MTTNERTAVTAIVYATIALILFMLATTPAHGQVRYGMLGEQPLTLLVERYNPRDVKPAGFCIGPDIARRPFVGDQRDGFVTVQSLARAPVTRVDTIRWADSAGGDTAFQVTERFSCPLGSLTAHYHNFGNCTPSRTDYEALLDEGHEFGVVYCGVARFYWREEAQAMLTPPLQVRHAGIRDGPRGLPGDRGRAARRRDLYYASLLAGVGAVRVFKLDPVTQGDTEWRVQDQGFHASAGFAIASAGMTAGVRPRDAVIGLCGAQLMLEHLKGRPSWRDMTAGCGGAALAWGWRRLFR